MTIGEVRDIVIIIFGIIGSVCFVAVLFTIFSVYKHLKVISNLTTDSLVEIRKLIKETQVAIKPIMQIIGIIEAATKGFDLVRKILGMKKEGEENDSRTVD
jgi:hypothetical protein